MYGPTAVVSRKFGRALPLLWVTIHQLAQQTGPGSMLNIV
jgi:hypothetical protein